MLRHIFISTFICTWLCAKPQEYTGSVPCLTVDDKENGYVLASYKIPSDGHYIFSLDGGLFPKNNCTIYYYEYILALQTGERKYVQDFPNVGSQAQDGNVCYFNKHDKNNKVSGIFCKDEVVELRLILLKSDVNGRPHKKLNLIENTLVSIEKDSSPVKHDDQVKN
jgi:hypothetical protein